MLRTVVLAAAALLVVQVTSADEGFRPLFNGKNLSGWTLVNTPPATWTVKDEMLICTGKPIGEIRTDKMYQNFIMEVEWRHMTPKGNAGIFVWADDITARGVPFHRSVEVQVLENAYGNSRGHTTHGDIFPIHGAKMIPINGRGGSRAFPTENRSKPSPEWNHYRIECRDGEISLAVNGKVVTRGKDASPRKGYICLESEGGIVHYRKLRIKKLPDTPVDPEQIAIVNRGYHSIYTGLDLSGWKTSGPTRPHWHANDWVLSYDGKADGNPSLSTEELYEDFGFIFDVKLKGATSVHLRATTDDGVLISAKNSDVASYLQEPGRWNRIEGNVRAGILTLTVNNQQAISETPRGKLASIVITPDGPADFANLYVRDLK